MGAEEAGGGQNEVAEDAVGKCCSSPVGSENKNYNVNTKLNQIMKPYYQEMRLAI